MRFYQWKWRHSNMGYENTIHINSTYVCKFVGSSISYSSYKQGAYVWIKYEMPHSARWNKILLKFGSVYLNATNFLRYGPFHKPLYFIYISEAKQYGKNRVLIEKLSQFSLSWPWLLAESPMAHRDLSRNPHHSGAQKDIAHCLGQMGWAPEVWESLPFPSQQAYTSPQPWLLAITWQKYALECAFSSLSFLKFYHNMQISLVRSLGSAFSFSFLFLQAL